MMGRSVPLKILTTDQPELPRNVQLQLERDALKFAKNSKIITFKRGYLVDEALPYALPEGTVVLVTKAGRQFIANNKPTLLIANPEKPVQKKKQRHVVYSVSHFQLSRALDRKANKNDNQPTGHSSPEPETT